jgi:hypothetical protein
MAAAAFRFCVGAYYTSETRAVRLSVSLHQKCGRPFQVITYGRFWLITEELVDSVVFVGLAFGGLVPFRTVLSIIVNIYVVKVVYETLATPFTYWCVSFLKRRE